jgi:hypothetical protein
MDPDPGQKKPVDPDPQHCQEPEAESKEKHDEWDPMPELIITSPYHMPTGQPYVRVVLKPYARVDLHPMPESTLAPSQGLWIWPQDRSCAHSKPDPGKAEKVSRRQEETHDPSV